LTRVRLTLLIAMTLALICLLPTSSSGQWLETTIYLPDSFGGMTRPQCFTYNTTANTVYVGGGAGSCVIAIDGTTNQKIARVPTGSCVTDMCYNPQEETRETRDTSQISLSRWNPY